MTFENRSVGLLSGESYVYNQLSNKKSHEFHFELDQDKYWIFDGCHTIKNILQLHNTETNDLLLLHLLNFPST